MGRPQGSVNKKSPARTKYSKGNCKQDGGPTKPSNPYQLFCAAERPRVLECLQTADTAETSTLTKSEAGKARFALVVKILGQRWAALGEEEKQGYVAESAQLKKRYKEELKCLKPSPIKQEETMAVEPYFSYLFKHWEETATSQTSLDGAGVQALLWHSWNNSSAGLTGISNSCSFSTESSKWLFIKMADSTKDAFDYFVDTLTNEMKKVQPDVSQSQMLEDIKEKWQGMEEQERKGWCRKAKAKKIEKENDEKTFNYFVEVMIKEVKLVQPEYNNPEVMKDLEKKWQKMGAEEKSTWIIRAA